MRLAVELAPPRRSPGRRHSWLVEPDVSASAGHVRELSFLDTPQGIVYWNTIYIQLGLDALPGRPADDELAGLTPTNFERVDALGIYTFDADRRAGRLWPPRAA